MPLAQGDKIGPYEIVALVGKGGMGEVCRARDVTLKRDVALKILPAEFARDAERTGRFRREAEVLASLNHPSTAQVFGFVESDGMRAIAMEFVDQPFPVPCLSTPPLTTPSR